MTSNIAWKSNHAPTTAQSVQAAGMSEKPDVLGPFSEPRPRASRTDTPHGPDSETNNTPTDTPTDLPTPILRRTSTTVTVEGSTVPHLGPLPMTRTVPMGGVQMTRLWQPTKNNARRVGVPGLLMGMVALRGVAAANIVPRAEPSITSLSTSNPTVPFNVHLTSMFGPPPQFGGLRQCPDSQERCGHALCYDPKTQWCCPSKMNVCTKGDQCGEGNSGDVTNGTDPRICTTNVMTASEAPITMVTTTTGSADSSKTTKENTLMPTTVMPVGSFGHRLGVPSVVRNLAMLCSSVRAIAFPAPSQDECYGAFCCNPGEVCARGSNGPKCWPDAGSVEVAESNDVTEEPLKEVRKGVENKEGYVHTSVAAQGDLGPKPNHGKKGSGARPKIPTLLYIFFLLVPFVAASIPNTASHVAPIDGTHQTSPNHKLFLAKRWSCHKPHQDCGPGCWDPSSEFCCQQPSGDYGLCAADNGESCCAENCCPQNYACQNQGQQYMCVPTDTSEKKEYNTTKNAMDKDDLKQKKKGGRSSAPGSTWVSL
jgi:hypothetical protein